MDPSASDVKQTGNKRPYNATGRQQQAARYREAIVRAAEVRFLRDGYATTTIAAIAADAGVSDHTIYKTFGGKPGLIRAIRARALQGDGSIPAELRSDALHTDGRDGRAIIEAWGDLTAEIMPGVAPIVLLIRDAAVTDAELRDLLGELDADRSRRMTDNARRLHAAGHLRPGITVAHAADILWTYSAPELYELTVSRRGWPLHRYRAFIAHAMIDALI
jgi:AcrR family transcriptional regulator